MRTSHHNHSRQTGLSLATRVCVLCLLPLTAVDTRADDLVPKLNVQHVDGPTYFWSEEVIARIQRTLPISEATAVKFRLLRRGGSVLAPFSEGNANVRNSGSGPVIEIPIRMPKPELPAVFVVSLEVERIRGVGPLTSVPPQYIGDQIARIGIVSVSASDDEGPWRAWVASLPTADPSGSSRSQYVLVAGATAEKVQRRGDNSRVLVISRSPDDWREGLVARQAGSDWVIHVPAAWQKSELGASRQFELVQLLTELLTESKP